MKEQGHATRIMDLHDYLRVGALLLLISIALASCDPPAYAKAYTLADVVRDIEWRQNTSIMLQRMGDAK